MINQVEIMTRNLTDIEFEVDLAAAALKSGHVILYPTDTIWGLGCDPENESAVERIYHIKKRNRAQKLLLLVSSIEMLRQYVPQIHPRIETLLVYHQQPLTLLYRNTIKIPPYLIANEGTVAIRVVNHQFCKELITRFGKPLVSSSANISGDPFPKTFNEISKQIKDQVDHIVSLEQHLDEEKAPSVLASFNNKGELEFIRE